VRLIAGCRYFATRQDGLKETTRQGRVLSPNSLQAESDSRIVQAVPSNLRLALARSAISLSSDLIASHTAVCRSSEQAVVQ
jgi:hypothetical protein